MTTTHADAPPTAAPPLVETRPIVVVDVETSALRPETKLSSTFLGSPIGTWGVVIEAAWWNLTTGEHGSFVPKHSVSAVRSHGEIESLTVSRYLERLATADQDENGVAAKAMYEQLVGATLAGSNPGFDAMFLRAMFAATVALYPCSDPEPWHHRLLDVSAYAAGVWGLPGHDLPGLAAVCERLDVVPPDHTAEGDVRAAGQCLLELGAVAGVSA